MANPRQGSLAGSEMDTPAIYKNTIDVGLVYDRASGIGSSVIGCVDLDYVGDLDKRRF
jgi:hypothetical protein